MTRFLHLAFAFTTLAGLCLTTGCGGPAETSPQATSDDHGDHEGHDHDTTATVADGHEHGEWWCAPHGVPEDECAICDTTLIAEFKAKGDWCEQHNRPDSQCFKCNPENFEPFAERYVAKFGERPPEPTN